MGEDDYLEGDAIVEGLEAAFVGTCDSGNCDVLTSAVVWTEEDGWLSMCFGHAIKELARPFLPE